MSGSSRDVDVLVVGAGPAGATVARLLAARGRRTVLIDPGSRATDRLEVLPPSGRGLIDALDLASLLGDPTIARPCLGIRRRWGKPETELDDFLCHPGSRGFVLDRARFDARLREETCRVGAECLVARLADVRRASGTVVARLEAGTDALTIAAAVAIDATGRPAALARRLGARRRLSERLLAERQHVNPPGNGGTEPIWLDIEGLDGEWSYEISNGQRRRERWSVARAARRLRGSGGERVDASAACLSEAAGEGWIAVGDAAAAFDPITSQGLVNALSTALAAAGLVISRGTVDVGTATAYSEMVASTFRHSEAGRACVYAALKLAGSTRHQNPIR